MGGLSPANDTPAVVAESAATVGVLSIPNNAATVVAFTAAAQDDLGAWSAGAPTLLTVPADGEYLFGAWWTWATDPAPIVRREGEIQLNGTLVVAAEGSDNNILHEGAEAPRRLAAGDTLRLSVFQNTGAALNLTSAVLWLVRVS